MESRGNCTNLQKERPNGIIEVIFVKHGLLGINNPDIIRKSKNVSRKITGDYQMVLEHGDIKWMKST